MDTLLIVKWQWPRGGSFWSTHADIGVDGRIRDWPGLDLNLTPVWARRLELGAGDDNLLAAIRKASGNPLSSATDGGEFSLAETETWVVEPGEDSVDLLKGFGLSDCGLSHDALSEFLIAENGSVEQLSDWATKRGQEIFARIAQLEEALKPFLPAYEAYVAVMRSETGVGATEAESRFLAGEQCDAARDVAWDALAAITFDQLHAVHAALVSPSLSGETE